MKTKIEKLDYEGRGISRINNKVTFIENALPDEVVEFEITKEHKKYNEGVTKKIIEKSINRVTPLCPYYYECGGCDLMHMSYESELVFKKEKVKNIFNKYLGIDIDLKIEPSNKEFNYRNKITLHGNKDILGYMKKSSNEIIEIDKCLIAEESINNYLKCLSNKEDIVIRTNLEGDIISNIKDENLIMNINDYKFVIDINSFFQVNSYICGKIFEFLNENVDDNLNVLDLYSGVGTLGISIKDKVKHIYSIEVNKSSYKNALKNKELNNVNNITFMNGRVNEEINKINDKIDLIITDPPRSGMDEYSLKVIKKIKPNKIIYISCEPMTLVRDLKLLSEYGIDKVKLFDMFPKTKNIESVCVLKLDK